MATNTSNCCVEDFEKEAKTRLDSITWGHYWPGSTTQYTLKDNVEAYNRYLIRPRVLHDVSNIGMSTSVLGQTIPFPIGIAPMGMQCRCHYEGERATARASARLNTCLMLSSSSSVTLEDVASENGQHLRWFQIYIYNDKDITLNLIKRAEKSGYQALVVTVDTPEIGIRYDDERNKFSLPPHISLANFKTGSKQSSFTSTSSSGSALRKYSKNLLDPSLTWDSIDWLASVTYLPVVIKGIMTKEDAREALNHNVSGIVVSNHGGRQLDGISATIDVLPEIVAAVDGKIEVYIDGGIRHGTDVLKALYLGAKAVFVGRPILWGLACSGENGICQVMNILKEEFRQAMVLSGCASIPEIRSIPNLVIIMAMFSDNDFFLGDAEASKTFPVKCSTLRKGGYAMLHGFPCKIMEMSKAQPGKHGHAKIHLIGLDVFTGRKHEDICPAKENIEVPVINRIDYQVINLTSNFLELMDQAGRLRDDIRIPESELGKEIAQRWEKEEDLTITVLEGMNKNKPISVRVTP